MESVHISSQGSELSLQYSNTLNLERQKENAISEDV